MAQPRPWLDEIIDTMKELGGHGTLHEIAEKILERDIMDFEANPSFRDRIRGTIYNHSSDGTYYEGEKGGEKDIFYSFSGIGRGHWGLRDFEPTENTVDITEDDMGFEEGKKKLKLHVVRERNPLVIKLAKERFKWLCTIHPLKTDLILQFKQSKVKDIGGKYRIGSFYTYIDKIKQIYSNFRQFVV
ncbi:hypothetical protein ABER98_06800 [Domibacillus aminovorans]|uniref:hypothetical protein n=1 Tax=Domibacillus aminovorans TaxID=29332 RepID=UPI003D1C5C9B